MKLTPKQIRLLLGLNQKEIGAILGCSASTIMRKEQGKSKWNVLEIEKLSEMANIPQENVIY